MLSDYEKSLLYQGAVEFKKQSKRDLKIEEFIDLEFLGPVDLDRLKSVVNLLQNTKHNVYSRFKDFDYPGLDSIMFKLETYSNSPPADQCYRQAVDSNPYEEAPLFSGYALGYRSWVVDPGGSLQPLFGHPGFRSWQPGVNIAHCGAYPGSTMIPHPKHDCGFNAFHGLVRAYEYRDSLRKLQNQNKKSKRTVLTGTIAGFGKIQVHKDGWRSSRARVIALLEEKRFPAISKKVARDYSVPIFKRGEALEEFSLQFAQPISEDFT